MAIFFAMPGNEELASELAELTCGEVGRLQVRRFPDGESYVRVESDVKHGEVFVVCTLARPDPQFLPLAYTAKALRQAGAKRVNLIAPYLAYMRQDRIFHPGELLTSRAFAELLQQQFDWLVTVDPHLHRHASLDQVYDIPTTVIHACPLFAHWIAIHVKNPIVVGPDDESAQWVEAIAREAGAPWTAFTKQRRGDHHVRMTAPDLSEFRGQTPVLVDDIVSSGVTMRRAIDNLRRQDFGASYCLAVHALCSAATAAHISNCTAAFVTSNSVPNKYARLNVAPIIAESLVAATT